MSGDTHTVMVNGETVTIVTDYWAKPIPVREFDWSAVTDNYDGAEDSRTRNQIGHGTTEQAAIQDLIDILES